MKAKYLCEKISHTSEYTRQLDGQLRAATRQVYSFTPVFSPDPAMEHRKFFNASQLHIEVPADKKAAFEVGREYELDVTLVVAPVAPAVAPIVVAPVVVPNEPAGPTPATPTPESTAVAAPSTTEPA